MQQNFRITRRILKENKVVGFILLNPKCIILLFSYSGTQIVPYRPPQKMAQNTNGTENIPKQTHVITLPRTKPPLPFSGEKVVLLINGAGLIEYHLENTQP